jgi:chromosome segregation ATPase
MSTGLYIGIGIGGGSLIISLVFLIVLRKRKTEKNPLLVRSKEMMVMLTQRIHSLNSRIQKLDSEVTELLIVQEKQDLSLTKIVTTLEIVPQTIETHKHQIKEFLADIEDLKEYRDEIDQLISENKKEKDWNKIEEILDLAKDKMKYRFT